MAAFLWTFEALKRLTAHSDPGVKGWAADRLRRLYPKEAGPIMTGLLRDRNESVVVRAAGYFCDHSDGNAADALLAAFRRSSPLSARSLAGALALLKDSRLLDTVLDRYARMEGAAQVEFPDVLAHVARLGTDASRQYVEDALGQLDAFGAFRELAAGPLFCANLDARTDMGKLLLFAYGSGVSGYVQALLAEVLNRTGAWCTAEDLSAEAIKAGKGEDSGSLASEMLLALVFLAEAGYKDTARSLEKLLKKRKFEGVLEEAERTALAIQEVKRREHGEEAFLRWEAAKEAPFFHCAALAALRATAGAIPGAQREAVAWTAIIVLAQLAESQSLIALNPETLGVDEAQRLFFEDRPEAPQDAAIMDLMAQRADVKSLVHEAVRRVGQFPFAEANRRIIRFTGRFMDEGVARELLAVDFENNGCEDVVAEAVAKLGTLSIPILRPLFEKNDPAGIPRALRIMEDLPTDAAVDLILAHWPLLWGEYKDCLLDAVGRIGDKRFISPLKAELKVGERDEGEVFRILCLVNGVADPELKRIEGELAIRKERAKYLRNAMDKGDTGAILREPLEIPLKCRSCGRVYHYMVERVLLVGTEDRVIEDRILCKKCGALDHCEITEEGVVDITARLALLALDPETAKKDGDDMTVTPVKSMSSFGKDIPFKDLVGQYEKKLKKDPESPELLIGYANALRQIKRREDAVPLYERAVRNDPLAVEAHFGLGEYAFDKGDFETAFSHYGKTAEVVDRGHYYRIRRDRDEFKEALLDRLMMVADRLGRELPGPGASNLVEPVSDTPPRGIGRNQPCPCGSGRKYKKCCLLKESGPGAVPAEPGPRKPPAADPVFHRFKERLFRYVEREMSRKDALKAMALFWNIEPREPLVLPERAAREDGLFHDWFIYDYRRANGKTILEDFRDRQGNKLSAEERRLAESLLKSHSSLYEVREVREGEGLTIRDVFTGETMDVEEVSGSYEAVQWDVIQVRVYRLDNASRFAGNGEVIPRTRLEGLKAYLDKARRAFEADTGLAGWPAFLKEKAFLLGRFFDEVLEERPVFLTEERHRMISAKARFTVSDYERARKILLKEFDFTDEDEIPSGGVSFSWVKRGPSKEWEMGPEREKGVVATSSAVHPSGQLAFTVLGTVNLHPDRLILECMSRERLERGKKRLLDLLGGAIRHRIDEFEDLHVAMERHEGKGEALRPLKDEKSRALLASVMQKYLSTWLDQAVPALGGKTPRQAVKTKAGREKVLGLIKGMENAEARKRKAGEPCIDLGPLRRELGIGPDEG